MFHRTHLLWNDRVSFLTKAGSVLSKSKGISNIVYHINLWSIYAGTSFDACYECRIRLYLFYMSIKLVINHLENELPNRNSRSKQLWSFCIFMKIFNWLPEVIAKVEMHSTNWDLLQEELHRKMLPLFKTHVELLWIHSLLSFDDCFSNCSGRVLSNLDHMNPAAFDESYFKTWAKTMGNRCHLMVIMKSYKSY